MTLSITKLCHYAECHCAECRDLFIGILYVIVLSVVRLNVVILSVMVSCLSLYLSLLTRVVHAIPLSLSPPPHLSFLKAFPTLRQTD